jgi:hypothetical protein
MAADGEQGQRGLSLDGVETELANPPQDLDGAAATANRRRRPISDASRIGKKLKGESWIMESDNLLNQPYLHMLVYHICKFLLIYVSFNVFSCKHKEIF